jgi:nitrile hydratase accessory protein
MAAKAAGPILAEPVFAAPWQAQAFALQVTLIEAGVFTPAEWAQELGRQLRAPGVCADGSDYYERWLAALEALAIDKGLTSALTLAARASRFANPEG